MRRRISVSILLLGLILSSLLQTQAFGTANASVQAEKNGTNSYGDLQWEKKDGVLTITGEGDLLSPEEYECPWTSDPLDPITEIVLGDRVCAIPESAFDLDLYYETLQSITLGAQTYFPKSNTEPRLTQLDNCANLTTITVSQDNEHHASRDGVLFNKDVTTLQIFPQNWNGSDFTVPSTVEEIDSGAFTNARNLTSIHFPASLKQIYPDAFSGCALQDVYFSGSEVQWKAITIEDGNEILSRAQMHYDVASYSVSYQSNGGSGEMPSETFTAGETLTLPECGFQPPEGTAFQAWEIDGKQYAIGNSIAVSNDITVKACWKAVETYTVSFDVNGGDAPISDAHVINGATYGTLPTPERAGFLFQGWYTANSGGEQIFSETTVNLNGPQTLYAHWIADLFPKLHYSFPTPISEGIPDSRYTYLFGNTALARAVRLAYGTSKNCNYGMIASSGLLFKSDSGVLPQDFRAGATLPSQLAVTDKNDTLQLNLREWIEAIQISWWNGDIGLTCTKNLGDLDALCEAVASVSETGEGPVVIALWSGQGDGHAVEAYRVERVSPTETRIHVYDSNTPNQRNTIKLVQNAETGAYTGEWFYDNSRSSANGGQITFLPYSVYSKVWASKPTEAESGSLKWNLLLVNSGNIKISKDGNTVATLENGLLKTEQQDICQGRRMDGTAAGSGLTSELFAVWLPVGRYTIENLDAQIPELEALMIHVELMAKISTEASTVTFEVNDIQKVNSVSVSGSGKQYGVTLTSSGSLSCVGEATYAEMMLSGTTGEKDMTFQQNGQMIHLKNVAVNAFLSFQKEGDKQSTTLPIPTDAVSDEGVSIPVMVTVSLDPNGGSGETKTLHVPRGVPTQLPFCEFEPPAGQRFAGWAIGSVESEIRVGNGELYPFEKDVTVYAVWENIWQAQIQLTETDTTVCAEIQHQAEREPAEVFCAFYVEHNRIVSVKKQSLRSGEEPEKIQFEKPENATYVKVFVLDDTLCPLCPEATMNLTSKSSK